MTDEMHNEHIRPLRLRHAIALYGAGLVFMYLLMWLLTLLSVKGLFGLGLLCVAYLAIGVALNRLVLRRLVEWHPMHNTLGNVANAKLGAVLFWPLSYLFLFVSLAINKLL